MRRCGHVCACPGVEEPVAKLRLRPPGSWQLAVRHVICPAQSAPHMQVADEDDPDTARLEPESMLCYAMLCYAAIAMLLALLSLVVCLCLLR
jgi:hypothetical protein